MISLLSLLALALHIVAVHVPSLLQLPPDTEVVREADASQSIVPVLAGRLPENDFRGPTLADLLGGDVTVRSDPVVPKDIQTPLSLDAGAAYAFDVHTGYQYFGMHEDDVLPLASVTKLVTAFVALDERPNWNQKVTLEPSDDRDGGKLRISNGEEMLLRDLWYASLVGSANNATVAIVRSLGFREEEFVARMNAKMRALGFESISFGEVTGLSARNVASAREIAHLAAGAFYQGDIFRALSTPSYVLKTRSGATHTILSTNELLRAGDPTVVVGKTGFTYEAGYNFVSLVSLRGHEIVVVIFDSSTAEGRFTETTRLVQWINENFIWDL